MNTRLQVEHTVTEMRCGVDLVVEQIRVAAGHRLSLSQADVTFSGHAIECRINAEDPANDFRPSPGVVRQWQGPDTSAGDVRVDTHVEAGYEVPPFYDSLLCKVITRGATRDEAADRMIAALEQMVVDGVPTTVAMHIAILRSDAFRRNRYNTRTIPGWPPA
jgi:acetyl-CoA carboxylase, biotin carboxylase subunit